VPDQWPTGGDEPDTFNYYCNDNAAIGLPGGPLCALVDIHGTLRSFSGAWAFGLGTEAEPPAVHQFQGAQRVGSGHFPWHEAHL